MNNGKAFPSLDFFFLFKLFDGFFLNLKSVTEW